MAAPIIRIPDAIQPGTPLRRLVDRASGWVGDRFPDLPFSLTAEWGTTSTGAISLRLSDEMNSRATEFQPDDLASRTEFQRRLNGLFLDVNGDTLRALSSRLQHAPAGGDD